MNVAPWAKTTAARSPVVLLLCMSDAHSSDERPGCHSTPWTPWLCSFDWAWCFLMSPYVIDSLLRLPNIWMTWVQDNMPASLWGPTERCRKIVIGTNNCGYSNECGCEAKICPKLPCYMLSCSCLPYSIQWSQNHIKPYNTFIFGMLWTTTNTNLRLQLWQLWVSMDLPEPLPGLPSRLGCLPKSEYRPQKTASKARLKWWKLIRPEMHGL